MAEAQVSAAKDRWAYFTGKPLTQGPGIEARCTPEFLESALGHLGDIQVAKAVINNSGHYVAVTHASGINGIAPEVVVDQLPPFCDVEIHLAGEGGHVARILVWVPIDWNGRFLGAVGGGMRTVMPFGLPPHLRAMTMDMPLRNGFATASTDGGNRKPEASAWGLIEGTNEVDWALTENLAYRSTHDMTVIGKAVTEALQGVPPRYSYLMGCSGGGRQALVTAQRFPGDYDGIWASDPATNFTRMIFGGLWALVVMKEEGVVLAPAKLEAFRAAAVDSCDGIDGLRDGIIGAFDPCDYDPRALIGTETDAGIISVSDAEAMAKIWAGPRARDGSFLWYGLRPGSESWGQNLLQTGLLCSKLVDGKLEPDPFELAIAYIRAWIVRDLDWDWKALTYAEFEDLYQRSVTDMAVLASDDPDLSAFRDAGGKLILSHGADDQLIPAAGTIDYHRRVMEASGSEEAARAFVRLFISEGDGHALFTATGPGLLVEQGVVALMKWVEEGEAPEEIVAHRMDFATGAVLASRPVYAYPYVPEYKGEGDPNRADSFRPVPLSERLARSAARSQQ